MAKIEKKKYWVEGAGFMCDGVIFTSDDKNECIRFANNYKKKAEVRESGIMLNGDTIHYKNY